MSNLAQYLSLAAVLFTIGAIGVVVRRNVLTVLMSIELMLNAANLTFVAFSRFPLKAGLTVDQAMGGHAASFFVIATAAAEAAVGLAIVIAVFRRRQTTHVDELTLIRDAETAEPREASAAPAHAEAH
jgi:NADH-quinone oxidoreductase subunit K